MKNVYTGLLVLLIAGFIYLFVRLLGLAESEMDKILFYGSMATFVFSLVIGFLLMNVVNSDQKNQIHELDKENRSLSKSKEELE